MSRKLTTYRNPPITTLIAQAPTIEWYDGLREKLIKLAKEQGACLT